MDATSAPLLAAFRTLVAFATTYRLHLAAHEIAGKY